MKNIDSNITIIGAGIAGLAVAIALRKAGLKNISIYERSNHDQGEGAGFVIWPNGSVVLKKLGLLEETANIGRRLSEMQRLTEHGEVLGAIAIHELESMFDLPAYAVGRKDFHGLLLSKAQQLDIKIHQQYALEHISTKENGKHVLHFSNGHVIESDVVLGADGRMRSAVRKYVMGDNTPVYQGYVNWVGVLDAEHFLDLNVLDYWGQGKRFGIVPVGNSKLYWAGCKALPLNNKQFEKEDKQELAELFDDWADPVKFVINATPSHQIRRIEVFDHHPISKWYKNNVCLIGDAAHASLPTSGQGVCQALEDAYHFARTWQDGRDTQEIFSAFQETRLQKTSAITHSGREMARTLFNSDPEFCEERNQKARLADYSQLAKGIYNLWSAGLSVN